MVAQLVSREYKCDEVTLASGNKVSAPYVKIVDGKVYQLNGTLHTEERGYAFNANRTVEGTYNYSVNQWNSAIEIQDVIEEFIEFIESDIQ